jgi:hypothetical protein
MAEIEYETILGSDPQDAIIPAAAPQPSRMRQMIAAGALSLTLLAGWAGYQYGESQSADEVAALIDENTGLKTDLEAERIDRAMLGDGLRELELVSHPDFSDWLSWGSSTQQLECFDSEDTIVITDEELLVLGSHRVAQIGHQLLRDVYVNGIQVDDARFDSWAFSRQESNLRDEEVWRNPWTVGDTSIGDSLLSSDQVEVYPSEYLNFLGPEYAPHDIPNPPQHQIVLQECDFLISFDQPIVSFTDPEIFAQLCEFDLFTEPWHEYRSTGGLDTHTVCE